MTFTGIGADGNVISELVLVPRQYSQENTPYECKSIENHQSIIEINPSADWSRIFDFVIKAQKEANRNKNRNNERSPRIEISAKIKSLNGSPTEFNFSSNRSLFLVQILERIIQTDYKSTNSKGLLIPLKLKELWDGTFNVYPALTES